jgi:hypothetical protein
MFRFSLSEHLGHHCCCIVSLRDVRKESAGYVCIKPGRGKTQPPSPNMCIIWWSGSSFVDMCNMGSILLYSTLGPHDISWVSKVLLRCPHGLFLCSQDIWDVLARSSKFSSCSKIFKLTKLYWLCPWRWRSLMHPETGQSLVCLSSRAMWSSVLQQMYVKWFHSILSEFICPNEWELVGMQWIHWIHCSNEWDLVRMQWIHWIHLFQWMGPNGDAVNSLVQ